MVPRFAPFRVRLPLLSLFLLAAGAARAESAAEVFAESCASCHGADGKAHTPMGRKAHARDLSESTLSDAAIERQIREGARGPHGMVKMPAFADKLTPDQIKALVEYVKSFRPRGN
jgi:mono/diheme cytochrome c family protein